VPVWIVAVFYVGSDFISYHFGDGKSVSYVGHLGGALAGFILWAFMAKKEDPNHDIELTGEKDVTPGRTLFEVRRKLKSSKKQK